MKSVLLKQKQSRLKWSKENESPYIHWCISSFYGDDYALVCGNSVVKVVFVILRLKHAQQEIKKKQADLKKTEQGYQKDKSAYDDVQKNLKALEVGTFVRKTIRPPKNPWKI